MKKLVFLVSLVLAGFMGRVTSAKESYKIVNADSLNVSVNLLPTDKISVWVKSKINKINFTDERYNGNATIKLHKLGDTVCVSVICDNEKVGYELEKVFKTEFPKDFLVENKKIIIPIRFIYYE